MSKRFNWQEKFCNGKHVCSSSRVLREIETFVVPLKCFRSNGWSLSSSPNVTHLVGILHSIKVVDCISYFDGYRKCQIISDHEHFWLFLGNFILCNSLIILETKMLESWCNSLPGKQIYEYLGQQQRQRDDQSGSLPNMLCFNYQTNWGFLFLIWIIPFFKKISLISFFVYEELDRLSMVEKLSIKWYFHSDATHLFSRTYIFSSQCWNTSEVLDKNDQDSKWNGRMFTLYIFPQYPFHQGPALPALWRRDLRACAKALVPLHLLISAFFQRNVNRDQIWLLGTWHHQARSTVDSF